MHRKRQKKREFRLLSLSALENCDQHVGVPGQEIEVPLILHQVI